MTMSTYLKDKVLGGVYKNTALPAIPTFYIALFTSDPTPDGSGNEVDITATTGDDLNYVRQLVTVATDITAIEAGPLGGRQVKVNKIIAMPASDTTGQAAATYTVGWWATFDAITAGNMLDFGALDAPKVIADNYSFTFAVNDIIFRLPEPA